MKRNQKTLDSLHNLSYKEEFEGNTERSTAAYKSVREDASTGLTCKLPLEGGYTRSLLPIILASSSPARIELLNRIKIIPSQIIPADIDETPNLRELPAPLAIRLAYEKAIKVASQIEESAIIIAADTVTAVGRRILPKATTYEEVKNCIKMVSGRRHRVYTGLCIIKKENDQLTVRQKIVQTIVKFKKLSDEEINFYCSLDEGIDKAGGCKISGYAEVFISFISGSYSNVMGLPLFETVNALTSLGFKVYNR